MLNWTKDQWDAFGRHVLTSAGSVLATLAIAGVITNSQAAEYIGHITTIVTAALALLSMLLPAYAAWRAARSASPDNQAKQTVKNLEQGVPLNGEKDKLIAAVADQPEVKNVEMVIPEKAREIPSDKVN